jgi:hypothetical protein
MLQKLGVREVEPEGMISPLIEFLERPFGLNFSPAVDETEGNVRDKAGTDATAR